MEQWEKNFYISAIAGANNGSSLVVMSKGNLREYEVLPWDYHVIGYKCFSAILLNFERFERALLKF